MQWLACVSIGLRDQSSTLLRLLDTVNSTLGDVAGHRRADGRAGADKGTAYAPETAGALYLGLGVMEADGAGWRSLSQSRKRVPEMAGEGAKSWLGVDGVKAYWWCELGVEGAAACEERGLGVNGLVASFLPDR